VWKALVKGKKRKKDSEEELREEEKGKRGGGGKRRGGLGAEKKDECGKISARLPIQPFPTRVTALASCLAPPDWA
jgi:hypothetical protein